MQIQAKMLTQAVTPTQVTMLTRATMLVEAVGKLTHRVPAEILTLVMLTHRVRLEILTLVMLTHRVLVEVLIQATIQQDQVAMQIPVLNAKTLHPETQ